MILFLLAACGPTMPTTTIPTGSESSSGGGTEPYDQADWYDNGSSGGDDNSSENNDEADTTTWYADCDNDEYGDADVYILSATEPGSTIDVCDGTTYWSLVAGDCNDANAAIKPGVSDSSVDGVDQDCNGTDGTTTNSTTYTYNRDADGDNYGSASVTTSTTSSSAPSGYVANDDDCDDSSASVSPAGSEGTTADGKDNDCDGTVDDGTSSTSSTSETVQVCATTSSSVAVMEVMVMDNTSGDVTYWGGISDWSAAGNTECQSDYSSSTSDDLSELFTVTGASTTGCANFTTTSGHQLKVQSFLRTTSGSYTWGANSGYSAQYFTVKIDSTALSMSGNDYVYTVP